MDIPMLVSKWTPLVEEAQPALRSVSLWVTLKNVPSTMFTEKGLEFLFSAVGKPIRLHPTTESCTKFDEAKMLVEADLTRELPREYVFMGEEDRELESTVQYSYPWLPPRCTGCSKWGHLSSTCLVTETTVGQRSSPSVVAESETAKETMVPPTEALTVPVDLSNEVSVSGTAGALAKGPAVEEKDAWIIPRTSLSPGKKQVGLPLVLLTTSSNTFAVLEEAEDPEETEDLEKTEEIEGIGTAGSKGKVSPPLVEDSARVSISSTQGVKARDKPSESSLRPSLSRDSKTAHKVIQQSSSQSFGCLLETRVKEGKVSRLVNKVFKDWSLLTNYEHNHLGRILGGLEGQCRKELWTDLRAHHASPIVRNRPWLVLGDFNVTLELDEHSGVDTRPVLCPGMQDFRSVVNDCRLNDLAYNGPLFTWSNKQDGNLISKKLDRVLVNAHWSSTFVHSYNVFEACGISDHLRCRVLLRGVAGASISRRPFEFVNGIAEMEEFKPLVKDFWDETENIYLSTSSLYRFSKKLKLLKPRIRCLAKKKMSNLSKRTKDALEELCLKQEANLASPSDFAMEQEKEAYTRWDHVSALEEKFLKQRSKLHWLQVGDRNNKAFHRAAAVREAVNTMREISIPADYEGISVDCLEDLLLFRCSEEDSNWLTRVVMGKEIKRILFAMPSDKSSGLDGYTVEFFRAAWDTLGAELVVAVQSFFAKGFLPKGLNSTILALIPKKKDAKEMRDYRPISCCNVLYKVISKVIANRLKRILPKFIAGNQSAFVADRLLIENVLLATELVKDYHKDNISTRCAMKVDISKAFDSVQWSFLFNV
ncbi:PREDICTED: uncharacterized protein LOC104728667 [Camelina sativa]|uniref:Uncharacterized protein LOC104728667 n=1 Tax=Camelina sativa TaxID=90675 RepID=A0ABM0UT64_CAMSA|nr:PREDICTED: uncharacterized protein LOC104728667 [Camelina sativa]